MHLRNMRTDYLQAPLDGLVRNGGTGALGLLSHWLKRIYLSHSQKPLLIAHHGVYLELLVQPPLASDTLPASVHNSRSASSVISASSLFMSLFSHTGILFTLWHFRYGVKPLNRFSPFYSSLKAFQRTKAQCQHHHHANILALDALAVH